LLDDPPRKYYHSIENRILHPAQLTRRPAQLHERMSARITCRIGSKKQYLGPNHHFLFSNPPRKYYHSIENRILHPAQLTRKPAQLHERMSARITCRIGSKKQYLGPNHHFLFSNPPRKYYRSIENSILHPAQLTRRPAQLYERMSARITGRMR
jgi:hypothetical protein